MNARRGSTASPIRIVKISSALTESSMVTWRKVRFPGVHGRLPELLGVHLAQALVPLDREALFAEFQHIVHELARIRELLFLAFFPDRVVRPVQAEHGGRKALELPELRRGYEVLVKHDAR